MNIRNEIESFKKQKCLKIPDYVFLRIQWQLSNTLNKKEDLFKMLQNENVYVNFEEILNVKDLNSETFYSDIIIYKEQNKKLFNFVFKNIFR